MDVAPSLFQERAAHLRLWVRHDLLPGLRVDRYEILHVPAMRRLAAALDEAAPWPGPA